MFPVFWSNINDKNHESMTKYNLLLILNTLKMHLMRNLCKLKQMPTEVCNILKTKKQPNIFVVYICCQYLNIKLKFIEKQLFNIACRSTILGESGGILSNSQHNVPPTFSLSDTMSFGC